MGKSTATRPRRKPRGVAKPYPTFPLYPHASGRWAKKVLGKTHFFGRWGVKRGASIVPLDDQRAAADAAKAEFDRQSPELYKREKPAPPPPDDGYDIFDLREQFLTAKQSAVDTKQLSRRSLTRYQRAADLLVKVFGEERLLESLKPADFTKLFAAISQGQNPTSIANEVRHLRIVLNYAVKADLVERPFKYGPDFLMPKPRIMRQAAQEHERKHGKRLVAAEDLRRLLTFLSGRGPHNRQRVSDNLALRAMILLGVNAGLGNTDCANLEEYHLDLNAGWLDYPRPKTTVDRRVPLWPETVEAVRAAMEVRPKAKRAEDRGCVFLKGNGQRWVVMHKDGTATDTCCAKFSRALKALGIKRHRLSFYALRHVCETVGGRAKDQVAMNAIMGHAPATGDMASKYIEEIGDDRLLAVTNTIREWLFGEGQ